MDACVLPAAPSKPHQSPCPARRCWPTAAHLLSPLAEDASLDNAEVVLQLSSGKRLLAFVLRDGGFSFSQVPRGVHTLSVQLSGLLYPTVKLDVGTVAEGKVAASAADVPGVSGRCVAAPDFAPALRRRLPGCKLLLFCALQGLPLSYPLLLRPFSRIEYFEVRRAGRDIVPRLRAARTRCASVTSHLPTCLRRLPLGLQKRQGFNLWAFLKTPYGMMAAFMLFSIFIMPRLKIDPEEYKEMMGQRDGGDDAPPAIAAAGAQQQGRRRSD